MPLWGPPSGLAVATVTGSVSALLPAALTDRSDPALLPLPAAVQQLLVSLDAPIVSGNASLFAALLSWLACRTL